MVRADEAFVLGTQVLGEADLIVTLFGKSIGKIRGVARQARRSRRRFGGSLEPMSRVRVRWHHREDRDLQRLEALELERSYADMQSDPMIQAGCAVLCDITGALSGEGDVDPRTFRLIDASLEAMRAGADPLVAVRYFEFWMLRLHGLLPDLSNCAGCHGELPADGAHVAPGGEGVWCRSCAGRGGRERRLRSEDLAFLREAAVRPPAAIEGASRAARPGGALEALLRGSLEAFLERSLKTYRHLGAAARPTAPHHG